MKIKLDKECLYSVEIFIISENISDCLVTEDYLIIDTESASQLDFYSAGATELYRKYNKNTTNENQIETHNYYGNILYNYTSIYNDNIIVDDNKIDLSYKPPARSDIIWQNIKTLKPFKELPIVAFDIETIDIEPGDIKNTIDEGKIILIGLKIDNDTIILSNNNEKLLLLEFIDILEYLAHLYDEWVITGHNVFNFDLQVIYWACKKHNIAIKMWHADYERTATYTQINGQPMSFVESRLYYGKCNIIDTWLLAGAEEKRTNNIESFSLKDLALNILNREDRRLELSYTEIKRLYEENNIELIKEYLLYDLIDQETLINHFLPPIYYLQSFISFDIQKIHYTGIGSLWNKLLKDWYKDKTNIDLIEPDSKMEYIGALTGINPGLYSNASKLDISSLYPSIMLRYQLAPLKDYEGVFLKILKYMLEKRLSIKNSLDKDLQYFQLALKIFINGGYGYTGTNGLKFNCMRTAALTTAIGRVILRKIFDVLCRMNVSVIEADTDGIIISTSQNNIKDIQKRVQKELPEGINIGIDWENYSIYVPKAKNYILYKPDGSIKLYGIYKKRNRSRLEKEFIIEYVRLYIKSPESAINYYRDICSKILLEEDISFVKVRQKIPKNNKWLLHLGDPGTIVEYYIAEEKRFHKKTNKPIKSKRVAIDVKSNNQTPIWSEYYLDILKNIKECIDKTIRESGSSHIVLNGHHNISDSDDYDFDLNEIPF